jgi:phospholipase/carboxylesterase
MDKLTHDAESGLSFLVKPSEASPAARLFLLHGVGSNEANLVSLAAEIDPRIEVILVRGPLTLGPGQYAWFQVRFGPQGPVINPDQADDSRRRLTTLAQSRSIGAAIEADTPILMAGFSQGGIMSASVGLSAPEAVRGFAILSGRILPELAPHIAAGARLQHSKALIVHGDYDDKLPVAFAVQSAALLTELGVAHEMRRYPVGHTLDDTIAADFSRWVGTHLQ